MTHPRHAARGTGRRRSERFERGLALPGWSPSSWGYDPRLESFWAELRPDVDAPGGRDGRAVVISRDHLITTLPGLARAIARSARVPDTAAYLALTA